MTDTKSVEQIARAPKGQSEKERSSIRNSLREEAKRARAEMPAAYRAHKSAELCKRLNESFRLTCGITGTAPENALVAVYSAFPEEVDLSDFITALYDQDAHVAFPCMVRDAWNCVSSELMGSNSYDEEEPDPTVKAHPDIQQTMEMRLVSAQRFAQGNVAFLQHPLKRYYHHDADLADFPYVAADTLTMVVVPVVGFDSEGNRLGYGAGNYDRYLTQLSTQCRLVGVAFAEQQVRTIPVENHDVPLPVLSL